MRSSFCNRVTSKLSSILRTRQQILQDRSAAAESTTDGNCISAELDQFLSEPLISRQDDAALQWKMNMHWFPQVSPLYRTRAIICI